jgi:hypothetical protein
MTDKTSVTLTGTVQKIIEFQGEPEKVQIAIEGADDLYGQIRIENSMTDQNGDEVRLKKGAEVEVTLEADKAATTPKPIVEVADQKIKDR